MTAAQDETGQDIEYRPPRERIEIYPLSQIGLPDQGRARVAIGFCMAEERLSKSWGVRKPYLLECISGCRRTLLSAALHPESEDIVVCTVDSIGNPLHSSPPLLVDVIATRVSDRVNEPAVGNDANMRPEEQIPDQPDICGIGHQEEITRLQ